MSLSDTTKQLLTNSTCKVVNLQRGGNYYAAVYNDTTCRIDHCDGSYQQDLDPTQPDFLVDAGFELTGDDVVYLVELNGGGAVHFAPEYTKTGNYLVEWVQWLEKATVITASADVLQLIRDNFAKQQFVIDVINA